MVSPHIKTGTVAALRYESIPKGEEESSSHSHVRKNYTRRELRQRIQQGKKVNDAGCWIWQGAKNKNGYGVMRFYFKQILTHRASYEAHIKDIPKDSAVVRTCGERLCINPKHLAIKTKRQACLEMNEIKRKKKDAKWQRKRRDKLRRKA